MTKGAAREALGSGRGWAPTCDGVSLGVLLAEGRVAQVTKMLKTAPDVQVGHQAGGGRDGVTAERPAQAVFPRAGAELTSTGRGTHGETAGQPRCRPPEAAGGPREQWGTR